MYLYGIEIGNGHGFGRTQQGFNCTFMELKFRNAENETLRNLRFNCTFMELKYGSESEDLRTDAALIVPLWN